MLLLGSLCPGTSCRCSSRSWTARPEVYSFFLPNMVFHFVLVLSALCCRGTVSAQLSFESLLCLKQTTLSCVPFLVPFCFSKLSWAHFLLNSLKDAFWIHLTWQDMQFCAWTHILTVLTKEKRNWVSSNWQSIKCNTEVQFRGTWPSTPLHFRWTYCSLLFTPLHLFTSFSADSGFTRKCTISWYKFTVCIW